jgi:Fur family ferric uptake transcriptional regulator
MRINRKKQEAAKNQPLVHLTPQRRILLETIREAGGLMDARELHQRAMKKDARISPATVYRNLRLFTELGWVEEARLDETRCYWEAKRSDDHYHLLCKGCGRVVETDSPLIDELVCEVRQKLNFEVTRAVLYLEGRCLECRRRNRTDGI